MPAIEVSRGTDGEFVINNGVTRATRVAKLLPNTTVTIEVLEVIFIAVGGFSTIEDTLQ